MQINEVKIVHYLEKGLFNLPMYIIDIDGYKYYSHYHHFCNLNNKNINTLKTEYSWAGDKFCLYFNELLMSPSIEFKDLIDGSYMFYRDYIHHVENGAIILPNNFNPNLENLKIGYATFQNCKLPSIFNPSLLNLEIGDNMFNNITKVSRFPKSLKLIYLPKLLTGRFMFRDCDLHHVIDIHTPKLINDTWMYHNCFNTVTKAKHRL